MIFHNDSIILSSTLNSITSSFTNLLFVKKYDPKFIYDHEEDRFILVFLVGNKPANSHVCVAFSSSNDPMDDWNVYMLKGDALETNHWTDYPAISLTKEDLFITGNLLLDGVSWQLGFNQSIIWQIDKSSGYSGSDSLSFNLWSDVKDDSIFVRNIHPVRGARDLQDNKNFSQESDTLYLIKIDEPQNSGNANIELTRIKLDDHYFLSPNGQQYNGKELSTNDSRVLGAIIDQDWIQFVSHSMDTNTGTAGIYHGIIYNYDINPLVESKILSDSIIDFGYPNIASTGINPNEKECIIGFNYTSVNDTNDTCRERLPHLFLQPSFKNGILFPNPGIELIQYDFTLEESLDLRISIYSLDGRLVNILYEDMVKSGPNRLTFNINSLSIGSYLLVIDNNNNRLFTKKLIKN